MCSKQRTSQSPVRTNPTAAQRRGAARSAVSPSSKTRGCIIPLLVDAAAEIVEVSSSADEKFRRFPFHEHCGESGCFYRLTPVGPLYLAPAPESAAI